MKSLKNVIADLEEKYPELKALRRKLTVEKFCSGDWTALYIDGDLVAVGDHYQAEEVISEILGVSEEQNDDYFLGSGVQDRNHVAETVGQIREYQSEKSARLVKARNKYADGLDLLKKAAEEGDPEAIRAMKAMAL